MHTPVQCCVGCVCMVWYMWHQITSVCRVRLLRASQAIMSDHALPYSRCFNVSYPLYYMNTSCGALHWLSLNSVNMVKCLSDSSSIPFCKVLVIFTHNNDLQWYPEIFLTVWSCEFTSFNKLVMHSMQHIVDTCLVFFLKKRTSDRYCCWKSFWDNYAALFEISVSRSHQLLQRCYGLVN